MEQIEKIIIDIDNRQLQENIQLHEGFLSAMKKVGSTLSNAGKYVSGVLHHKKISDISKEIYDGKLKNIKDLDASEKQLYADIEFLLTTLSYIKNKKNQTYDVEHPKAAIEHFLKDYALNNFQDDNAEYADSLNDILSTKLKRKIINLDNSELEQYHLNNKSVYDYLADLQNKGSVPKFIQKYGKKGTDKTEIAKIKAAILCLKRFYQETCIEPAKSENASLIYNKATFMSQMTLDLQKLISSKGNSAVTYKTVDGKQLTMKQLIKEILASKKGWKDISFDNLTSDDIIATIAKYQKYFINNMIWIDSDGFGNYYNYVLDKIDNANDVISFERAALSYFICATTEKIHQKYIKIAEPSKLDAGAKDDYAITQEISKIYGQLVQGQSFESVLPKLKVITELKPDGVLKGGYYNQILTTMVDDLIKLNNIGDIKPIEKETNIE